MKPNSSSRNNGDKNRDKVRAAAKAQRAYGNQGRGANLRNLARASNWDARKK